MSSEWKLQMRFRNCWNSQQLGLLTQSSPPPCLPPLIQRVKYRSTSRASVKSVLGSICLTRLSGPSELKIQITISTDKTVLDLKHAIAEKSDVEADRQRLIYSGQQCDDFVPGLDSFLVPFAQARCSKCVVTAVIYYND
jgi:Ubiquitin family